MVDVETVAVELGKRCGFEPAIDGVRPTESEARFLRSFAAEVLRDAAKQIAHNPIKMRLRLMASDYEKGTQ